MSNTLTQLPEYDVFCEQLNALALPVVGSEVHGTLCAYLCGGALAQGEAYLRALITNHRGESARIAAQALFNLYTISQHQMDQDNFSFQLLLPDDINVLSERAQAFSQWCLGFTKAIEMIGLNNHHLEEDTQDALLHVREFSELDYHAIQVSEDDEKALVEVIEYTRMAVLRVYWDLKIHTSDARDEEPIKH